MVWQVMHYYKIDVGSRISSRIGAELKKIRKDCKMKVLSFIHDNFIAKCLISLSTLGTANLVSNAVR